MGNLGNLGNLVVLMMLVILVIRDGGGEPSVNLCAGPNF